MAPSLSQNGVLKYESIRERIPLARILGPRYESFRLWCQINGYFLVSGFVLLFVWRPLPIGVRTPTFAIAAGLILVGSGVMVLVTGIQVYVWE